MPTILRPNNDANPDNWVYSTSDTPTFNGVAAGSYQIGHVEWSSAATVTADATAPVLSSPTDAANGDTGYTGSVSTDTAGGTLYFAAYTGGTPPSAAQIIAGTGGNIVSADSQAVSATGVQNVSGSGLTASTAYKLAFVHVDAAITPNTSAVASGDGFTTTGPVVNVITDGEFTAAAGTNWAIVGAGTTITGGKLVWTAGSGRAEQPIDAAYLVGGELPPGTYAYSFDLSGYGGSGSIRLSARNVSDGVLVQTAHIGGPDGTKTGTMVIPSGCVQFWVALGSSPITAEMDNLTLTLVP